MQGRGLAGVLLMLMTVCSEAMETSLGWHLGQDSDVDHGYWQQVSIAGRWRYQTVDHDEWRLRVSSGWLQLDERSGVADTWLGANQLWSRPWGGLWWDWQARLKLPTANAGDGMGTGSLDKELKLQALSKQGDWLWWGFTGYRWRGHSDFYPLQNTPLIGAGAHWQRYSLAWDWQQGARAASVGRHHLILMAGYYGRRLSLSPYLSLNDQGDTGAGITLRF